MDERILWGLIGSLLAGSATAIGAMPAIFLKEISDRTQSVLLGGAAGVMLAASSFSLIIPGIESGAPIYGLWSVVVVAAGLLLGGLFLDTVDRLVPHEHFGMGTEGPDAFTLKRIWLFVFAITIHNFPEGMAVGVGFGSGDTRAATSLAIGIGLQNMPEGLAVALPLLGLGYSRTKAIVIASLSGLVEPIGGFLGAALVTLFSSILPWAMGFAAGAMLFVISDEIIPETHRKGFSRPATFGLLGGFVVMMLLDNLLG